jgi:hypothetical protein
MIKTMMAATFGSLIVVSMFAGNYIYAAQSASGGNGADEVAQSEPQSTSDNPAGSCPGNLNPGDICREGVCHNGERTVYRCDANRDCKPAGKEECNDSDGSSSNNPS